MAGVGPVVEEREHAEPLGADEALRADDRDAVALLDRGAADLLGVDLRLAVGADADQRVGLVDRVLLRHAVDGGRGDLDHAVDLETAAGAEHVAAAVDLGGEDVLLAVERQRGRAVDHDVAALDRAVDRRLVAHVAERELKPRLGLLGVVEVRDVEHPYLLHALRAQEPYQIDSEKPGTAGY